MFLVGIVAGEAGVVLHVDGAGALAGGQVAGAIVGGKDDAIGFAAAIADGVATDFGGGVEIGELTGGRGDFLEPPDPELRGAAGQSVDRNDRAPFGGGDAGREGIDVGHRRIGGAAGNVAGNAVIGGRRSKTVADKNRTGKGGAAVAFDVAIAVFVGLGHETDIPDAAIVPGEFEQHPAELVAGKIHEETLARGVEHGFVLLGIILVNYRRNLAAFKFQAGAGVGGAAIVRDDVLGEGGDGGWPDLEVFVERPGPVELEAGGITGRRGDGSIELLQPIEDHLVFDVVFVLGVVNERAVGPRGTSVVADRARRRVGEGLGDQQAVFRTGPEFLAQVDGEGRGRRGLGDGDDIRSEEFVGAVLLHGTEVFHHDATSDVVGVDLTAAIVLFEPDGAKLGDGLGIGVGRHRVADRDKFGGDECREDIAVNGIHRVDPATGNQDARCVEALLRPVERAYRVLGGGRDGEYVADEDIVVVAVGHTGPPPDGDLTGFAGKDLFGVGAVVEMFVNAGGERGNNDIAGVGDGDSGGVFQGLARGIDDHLGGAHRLSAPEASGGRDRGPEGVNVGGGRRDAIAQKIAGHARGERHAEAGPLEYCDGR